MKKPNSRRNRPQRPAGALQAPPAKPAPQILSATAVVKPVSTPATSLPVCIDDVQANTDQLFRAFQSELSEKRSKIQELHGVVGGLRFAVNNHGRQRQKAEEERNAALKERNAARAERDAALENLAEAERIHGLQSHLLDDMGEDRSTAIKSLIENERTLHLQDILIKDKENTILRLQAMVSSAREAGRRQGKEDAHKELREFHAELYQKCAGTPLYSLHPTLSGGVRAIRSEAVLDALKAALQKRLGEMNTSGMEHQRICGEKGFTHIYFTSRSDHQVFLRWIDEMRTAVVAHHNAEIGRQEERVKQERAKVAASEKEGDELRMSLALHKKALRVLAATTIAFAFMLAMSRYLPMLGGH